MFACLRLLATVAAIFTGLISAALGQGIFSRITESAAQTIARGTRLAFYSAAATVPGSRTVLVWKPGCNPERESCWQDQRTGETFGEAANPGASGQGITLVDVLYVDAGVCVLRLQQFTLDPLSNLTSRGAGGGLVSRDGTCGDYWQPPERLAALGEVNAGGTTILRGRTTIGGDTFSSVDIGTSGPGASTHYGYDAETGILRVASTRGTTAGVMVPGTGQTAQAGAGAALLTYTRFLGAGVPFALPGDPRLPPPLQRLRRVLYQCATITGMQNADAQPLQVPCTLAAEVVDRGPEWLLLRTVQRQRNGITGGEDAFEGTGVIARSGPGWLYADPEILAGFRAGEVVSADPLTGMRMTVAAIGRGEITLVEEGGTDRLEAVYDLASGWLRRSRLVQTSGLGFTAFDLTLAGVE